LWDGSAKVKNIKNGLVTCFHRQDARGRIQEHCVGEEWRSTKEGCDTDVLHYSCYVKHRVDISQGGRKIESAA